MEISINSRLNSIGHLDDIVVYDNFLDVDTFISLYRYICNKQRWEYGHLSNPINNQDHYEMVSGNTNVNITPLWRMLLTEDTYFSEYIFDKVKEVTKRDWNLEMIYANGQTYGQLSNFHVDNPDGYTFLIYANIHWDLLWGGKTIFCDQENIVKYIEPIPNRAVFFPGTILHSAEPVTRNFRGLRITVAYKLFPKEES